MKRAAAVVTGLLLAGARCGLNARRTKWRIPGIEPGELAPSEWNADRERDVVVIVGHERIADFEPVCAAGHIERV